MTENEIRAVLSGIKYPGFDRDIVSLGFVRRVAIAGDQIAIDLEITSSAPEIAQTLRSDIAKAFAAIGRKNIALNILQPSPPKETSSRGRNLAPNIKRFVMISSGKGGVGKSTTAVNLAIAAAMQGKRVGLLDADIYGPNAPRMLGLENERLNSRGDKVIPPEAYGIKVMSMGMILEPSQALIWRGPMIIKTIEQFFNDVAWGDLDILFMDMPPGTGDAQLSLAQATPVSAGVVVTTPQTVALDDARRAIDMFIKMRIPIAGVIENMSGFICPCCNKEYDIFGKGGSKALAQECGAKILAEIPIEPAIREGGDSGKPIVFHNPSSETAKRYLKASDRLLSFLENAEGSNADIQPTTR
ncbi:MAG: Mrp/NBP35 family ATP-binding protein [Helicobacteraceae bacterium]|jgi:ATP-binding protein involved in chromosome partitioning|nr:Mrp/NBP35 family ATP-binding protein [Helicobacteraceae bacterium]